MSTPSPLLPPGVLESATAPKSRIRITVLTILALHIVFIGGLLLQGCNKGANTASRSNAISNSVSSLPSLTDTNFFTSFPGDTATVGAGTATMPGAGTGTQAHDAFSPPLRNVPPQTATVTESPSPSSTTLDSLPSTGIGPATAIPPSQTTEHTIKKGDTIGALAKHYGVSERAIIDANPTAKPRSLKVNDKLIIPPPMTPAASTATLEQPAVPPGGEVYIVKNGDNLTRIATKFGVTVKQLRSVNNIHGDRITAKQRLIIPPKTSASTGSTTSSTPTSPRL